MADLAGKQVIVRGRVVKYTANIMGHNWIHIQDGTAKIGHLVLVRGTAATNKD